MRYKTQMEAPSESVFPDNEIFHCKESNNLCCRICTIDAICEDWRKHVRNPRHVGTLERFNLVFNKSSKGVVCKVCAADLDWKAVKTHANCHRIVPWYVPADRYKNFFKNHMLEWETQFYCYLCDLFFPEWSTAYVHISDERHQNLLKDQPIVNDAFGTATEVPYDILVSEGFVSAPDSATVKCTICECSHIGIRNVVPHVKGFQHTRMKVEFVQNFRDWKDAKNKQLPDFLSSMESSTKLKAIDSGNCENASVSLSQHLPCLYIVEQTEDQFCCKICDLEFFSRESIDYHVKEASHESALKKYGCENIRTKEPDYIYHCVCCDCSVLGIKNVQQHVRGFRHRNSLSETRAHSQKQVTATNNDIPVKQRPIIQSESLTEPGSPFFLKNHIRKVNNRELHCRLCDESIMGVSNVRQHLRGKIHLFGAQQLSEYISWKEGMNYHCKCCDCTVPGIENVYGHINGNRHAKSLNDSESQEPKASIKNLAKIETQKQPESVMEPPTPPHDATFSIDHIEKRNSRESHCRLCDKTVSGDSNLQKHLTRECHVLGVKLFSENIALKEGNRYHCRCCDCMIPGVENVYCHIKGNRHAKSMNDSEKHKEEASIKSFVEIGTPKPSENATNSRSVLNDGSLPNDHIEKRNNRELYCRLCNKSILGDANVKEHLTLETHVSIQQQLSKYISSKKENNYHCGCCDCVIPGVENIYRHINGVRHAKTINDLEKHEKEISNSNLVKVEAPKQPEGITEAARVNFSYEHIFKLSNVMSCCKICNCKNLEPSTVDGHVAGKPHTEALKQFSDKISLKKNDKYYCKCCDCTVFGIDNVYTHLQGSRHTISLNASDKEQGLKSTKTPNSLAKQIEPSKKHSNPRLANPQDNFQSEVTCRTCGVFFARTSDLHSHLVVHVGEDFIPRNESVNINEIKDDCSESEKKGQNGTTELQLSTEIEGSKETEVANRGTSPSFDTLRINGTTILTKVRDFVTFVSPESVPLDGTINSKRPQRSPRKSSLQRIVKLLNFDNDYIHDMRDKLRETELGMKLCSMKDTNNIYCLICRIEVADTVQNYLKHLRSIDHCEYLEGMEKDHALFELVPGQFSEFDLVGQYMEEVSEDTVRCHACDKNVDNIDTILKDHINDNDHEKTCKKMHLKAKQNFQDVKSLLQCNWYDIYKYWCVPCSEHFESELSFAKHLRSTGHTIVMRKSNNSERGLIYDFCAPCALLWFGFRCTYAKHCESPTHKWTIWKGHHESQDLPETVKSRLFSLERYTDDAIKHFYESSAIEREKEESLIRDIELSAKFKFPNAKAFVSGSRVSGFRTGDNDVEIFLDCDNMYDGKELSEYEILYLMTSVHQCLSKDAQSWDMSKHFTNSRSSSLRARHRMTGLICEISFENGLAVENMKLIRYLTNIFPPCRTLILFLNQWLVLCDLVGPQGILYHALYWCVIFYLQKESLLPSVASLIAMKNDSHVIAGWEVGLSLDFTHTRPVIDHFGTREFLIRFFTFYTKFDYRYDVACPLLGQEVKKRAFADPRSLPNEMAPYINYMMNSDDPRPFRIDSVICIQDPLNLQHNITEAASKAYLNRFRAYCFKSLDTLCSKT